MTEKLRPKLIKSNAVRGPFFQKNELDEKNSDKNMLKDYVAQPMTTIKTVVQPLSESGTFEISCKCFAAAAVDTAPDKDDFNRRILCTWKVERSYKDLDNCLQSIKELNGSIKEFSLLHKEDIAKAQELIDQLQSMKNLSVVIQDFLTENFCDFSSNDCRSKNSSFKEENFVAKNIFVSALVVSSGVVVACIVGSVSFMFREGVLPSLLGFMLGTVYLMIHLLSYLRTVIQVALLLTVILATFHRLLGFIVSLYIRNLLGWSKENRKFDINIDWIALRIGWDKNQVLLSGIEWKNPPPFKSTPCFVSIKEVSLTLSNQFLYRALCQLYTADESIVIDEVVIDGVNVYIEKTDKKEEGLNIWAAMGAKSLEDEKKYSGNLMSLLSSAGNMTVGALSSTATVGINAVTAGADLGYKAVSATANAGLSAVNATAAAGSAAVTATAAVGSAAVTATADVGKIALSTTKDIGSSIGSTFYSTTNFFGITKKDKADGISAVPAPVLSTPPKVIESNDQDKDDEDENPADSPWRDVADAPGFIEEDVADVFRKKEAAEKKEITLEINRVLLMNINLHVQSTYLSSTIFGFRFSPTLI